MLKKIFLVTASLFFFGLLYAGWKFLPVYQLAQQILPSTAAEDYAQQDDSRVTFPDPLELEPRPHDPLKNVYWGELHVHTKESLDAVLFGTTATIEDAYRFAQGEPLMSPGGELMQLSRPLDFVAITDHAEGFGLRTRCSNPALSPSEKLNCWIMETPGYTTASFLIGRQTRGLTGETDMTQPPGVYRNRSRPQRTWDQMGICSGDEGNAERCRQDRASDWSRYIELADRYYKPGAFTTFVAYEYSPTLAGAGKHHRNVIFNGDDLPQRAISARDVNSAVELWRGLEKTCLNDCDFLTIPHNMNKGWGLFYSRYTYDGGSYREDDWRLRKAREPLAEMYQVKGTSECAFGVGSTDEECNFEQVLKPCAAGQETGCAFESSFVRQGLKTGLELNRELGFNPMQFGFIAATDGHNANPGDAEEWDFPGKVGAASSPAVRRLRERPGNPDHSQILTDHGSGGLAAVWAEENTRDSIFAGMKRREAYATSGPRIMLRFFASWGFSPEIVSQANPIAVATETGVPMGGVLKAESDQVAGPTFFIWAGADPLGTPLQSIQVIKGWIDEDGKTHESVRDVICANGVDVNPETMRCPDNGADVDISSCETHGEGAAELKVAWQDKNYDASQNAFYYARVIQNPSCRWSTYDAIRLGREPNPRVPATIRERAWSSPIWVDPAA